MLKCFCLKHDTGFGDLAFDLRAYLFGFASVLSQAMYLLLVQKHADDIGAAEALHLNSYNTLPMLLICSVGSGELHLALRDFALSNIGFILTFTVVIVFGCLLNYLLFLCTTYNSALTTSVTGTVFGCLLNYLLFLCTTYNSALTTSVTGTLKTIIQTVIGMFTFGGISINIFTILGMTAYIWSVFNGVTFTLPPVSTARFCLTGIILCSLF